MKIGIITFHFPLNYGAVLQAYALAKYLRSIGHHSEFIDYQPNYHVKRYQWKWKYCGLHPTNFIYPLLYKRFNLFRSTHLKLTSRLYRSLDELVADPPKADAYICGSDQIWNPQITDFDIAYFLAFGIEAVKRIAYAGSFGKTELTQEQQKYLKPYFQGIKHISVREQSGAEVINTICGRQVECVLDPTLLIDGYESITEPCQIKDPYVLLINLQNNSLLNHAADFVSRELQLPKIVLNNYSLKLWEQKGKRLYPGPGGYLGIIKQAGYVVTNSFHGTIFSILFQKPFLTTALSGHGVQKNTRITGLLNSLGLLDHFLDTFSESKIRRLIKTDIDWKLVSTRLNEQREKSISFLKIALNN